MIEVRELTIVSGSFRWERISFRVESGEYAVLMGPTGCGKTTLLESLCGLRTVRTGSILLQGIDVTRLHPAERNVGYVPQDLSLFPTLTVAEHLEFALKLRKVSAAERKTRVQQLTELLGLGPLLERRPTHLSGGESQRVALGRALSFHPRVLLLDEPLSALDDSSRDSMHQLLKSVQRETGVTTLHVTHSRTEADAMADRQFEICSGEVVITKRPSDRPATLSN